MAKSKTKPKKSRKPKTAKYPWEEGTGRVMENYQRGLFGVRISCPFA